MQRQQLVAYSEAGAICKPWHQKTAWYKISKDKICSPTDFISADIWKIGDRGLEPHSGIWVLKKQNASSTLTRKDSISVTER